MTTFLALWLATQVVAVLLVWAFAFRIGRPERAQSLPRAVVIVAVKGHHAELDAFLDHLFAQDYPSFRVVFGVESPADTAIGAIEARRAGLPGRIALAVAGLAPDEGQKVANLRAALAELTPDDDVVVFADSDIRPDPDWLTRLIAPLTRGEADIVSGFAWLVAKDGSLPSLVMCAMAATMVTVPRLPLFNACWGGSTAMRRERCEAFDLRNAWRGTLSDDLSLTALAQQAGCVIAAPHDILPRLYVATAGFDEVVADAERWMMLFRVHMPATYVLSLAGLTFAAAGWLLAAAAAAMGEWPPLAAALALAVLRSAGRATIVARRWGAAGLRENRRYLLLDPLLAPVAALMNAFCTWRALFRRHTEWAGVTYEIAGPRHTKVLARRSAT